VIDATCDGDRANPYPLNSKSLSLESRTRAESNMFDTARLEEASEPSSRNAALPAANGPVHRRPRAPWGALPPEMRPPPDEPGRERPLRIALFADSFHEVNGFALTCRQFHGFAQRRGLPFMTYVSGPDAQLRAEGGTCLSQIPSSSASVPVDGALAFDPLFGRHYPRIKQELEVFQPDLIHFTSLGNCGILGQIVGKSLGVPTVASWHTNLHEFGALRLRSVVPFLPDAARESLCDFVERFCLAGIAEFYRPARMIFAPNPELASLLETRTGKPARIMRRGVDSHLFSPRKRTRTDDAFVLGFVGRLNAEKNVRMLRTVEEALVSAGRSDFKFVIVGDGGEKEWLEQNMQTAEFPGVLEGEDLARAYANLDLFLFPSHSDTFGNVIQESHASGVPAVVTSSGGPKFLVEDGVNGFVARDDRHFLECVLKAMDANTDFAKMRLAAREQGEQASWDRVFENLYDDYRVCYGMLQRGEIT